MDAASLPTDDPVAPRPPGGPAPSVTVVIATRDRPALLRRAVESVLAQRYPGDVHVIAVFDQSDPEADLAHDGVGAGGAARRVRVRANERTPGLAGARNTGITAATGELVAFCDDDDLWLPGKLAAQAERLAAEPDLELVTTGVLVEARGKVSTRVLERDRITHDELLRSRVSEAHPSTFLFRRSALVEGIGLVDEALPGSYAEDYDVLLRAARRHPVGVVTLPLAKVFWHRSSFFAERWQTIVDALDHILAAHPELATEPRGLARIEGQQAFARASMHDRRGAWRTARRALAHNRREPRAWLALAVASGAVRSEWVLRALQATGRGI
ncbi:MAG TPA: glycosyltransferase family A protein [Acidimicrobiales bacterium]|nr:glycosyltransferase family A protein [Acidimicrobiales bacterium]